MRHRSSLGPITGAVAVVSAVLYLTLVVSAQQLDEAQFVLKARKCEIVVNVQWNRHDTNFPQKSEFSKVFAAVDGSGLRNRYTQTSADHADLIFKLDDDALLDRITLEVLNPDDNSAVYFETRDRVAVENDVKRLIAHFLAAVDSARDMAKATDEPSLQEQTGKKAPSVSAMNDPTPSYVWIGRFDREDKAQIVAKKVEDLGLPVAVVPRHSSNSDFFVVVTGPYGANRVESAIDWLKTQGFSDVRVIKNPPAAGSKEPD